MSSSNVIDPACSEATGREQELSSQSHSFRREWAGSERVLLVEPDNARRARLCDAVRELADVDGHKDFLSARTHLLSRPYDWLVTNSRLGEYNGLHLVHLARASRLPIRILVYSDQHDVWLAREAQRIGAFYECRDGVDRALSSYLCGALPPEDRPQPGGA